MTDNAEWNAAIDAALTKVREQRAVFSSDAYATPQPIGGFMERFACNSIEVEIEALRKPDTPPTPAAEEREAVARAIEIADAHPSHQQDHAADNMPDDISDWGIYLADAALSALAQIRAAEILAAEANERARIEADLKDPQIVHMNMLRGGIAKINVTQAMHLNGWTSIDNWHRMTVEQIEDAVKARNEHGAGK